MDIYDKTALERLQEYLATKKMPVGRLEKMAGLANGYIRKNKGSLSSNKLADILSVASDLNGDWLLTGRGNMFINQNYVTKIQHEETTIVDSHDKGTEMNTKIDTLLGDYNETGRGSLLSTNIAQQINQANNQEETAIDNNLRVNTDTDFDIDAEAPTDYSGMVKYVGKLKYELIRRIQEIKGLKTTKDENEALKGEIASLKGQINTLKEENYQHMQQLTSVTSEYNALLKQINKSLLSQ